MADRFTFMKDQFDAEMEDENNQTTEQEMAYILFAAAKFAFTGEKINIGEVFGKEFKGLNRSMPNIYTQIEKIINYGEKFQGANQKYNDEEVKALAAQGLTQKEICEQLGYDASKSKSLSSNKGYKEGRQLFLERKRLENESLGQNSDSCDSSSKNCQKTVNSSEKIATSFNF